jgi:predicted ATP-dependent endonuclease of OLD family
VLKTLFADFVSLENIDQGLMVTSKLAKSKDHVQYTRVEIGTTGSAFRKVFTGLVLLFTLALYPEKVKVLLMEEPEAQLHPELSNRFINYILHQATKHKIQLVIATTSHQAFDLLYDKVPLVSIHPNVDPEHK